MKNGQKSLALAVDLGGTNVRVAAIGESGAILSRKSELTIKGGKNGEVVTGQIISLLHLVGNEVGLENCVGIGVGSAGAYDSEKGAIRSSNMGYDFIPLLEPLKRAFGLPVFFLNDAAAAALGEMRYGLGKNIQNFVYITMSTGIGGGVVVDGKLLSGRTGNAGEIGHFIIEDKYDLRCGCDRGSGHWEAYCSGKNIPKFFNEWLKIKGLVEDKYQIGSAEEIFKQAMERDPLALEFMEELGKMNGKGISNVILAYNPEWIILGGSVALNNGDLLIEYLTRHVDDFLTVPEIMISKLGADNALLGAAARVFEKQD